MPLNDWPSIDTMPVYESEAEQKQLRPRRLNRIRRMAKWAFRGIRRG